MLSHQNRVIQSIDKMTWLDFNLKVESTENLLSYAPRWPLFCHIIAAVFCMGSSAVYHLCYVKSERTANILCRIDYGGISIMILGSCISPYYYSFACGSAIFWRYFYIIFSSAVNLFCFGFSVTEKFQKREYNWLRGLSFFLSAVACGIPIFHMTHFPNKAEIMPLQMEQIWLGCWFYVAGVVLYGTHVPERCKPGTFDILGHSHQIFHCCVVAGCVAHYYCSLQTFHMR